MLYQEGWEDQSQVIRCWDKLFSLHMLPIGILFPRVAYMVDVCVICACGAIVLPMDNRALFIVVI